MFNHSSNIFIRDGVFIVINGNGYQADSASQSTAGAENHNNELDPTILRIYREPDTGRSPHRSASWEGNAQNYSEPETYPTAGRPSTMSFGTPVHSEPCPMPTPTFSREGSLRNEDTFPPTPVMSVDASRETTTPNNDSPYPPFPMPEYYPRPQYATQTRHLSTFPEPEHFSAATYPAPSSFHHPIRASTWSG